MTEIKTPIYRVTKDGKQQFLGTEPECHYWLNKNQPQSVEWAKSFDGWGVESVKIEYECDDDTHVEDDCRKMDHYVFIDGVRHEMDFSPYECPSEAIVAVWVALGCPRRVGIGPLSESDIIDLARERVI